jgi:hypothetical protein
MNKVQVRMALEKQTKNTFRFVELDDQGRPVENMYQGKIGQLYVKQSVFNGQRPMNIVVTIEEG